MKIEDIIKALRELEELQSKNSLETENKKIEKDDFYEDQETKKLIEDFDIDKRWREEDIKDKKQELQKKLKEDEIVQCLIVRDENDKPKVCAPESRKLLLELLGMSKKLPRKRKIKSFNSL